MMKKHPTFIPAAMVCRADSNMCERLTRFLMALSTASSPDSGAKANSWQPARFIAAATSPSTALLRAGRELERKLEAATLNLSTKLEDPVLAYDRGQVFELEIRDAIVSL